MNEIKGTTNEGVEYDWRDDEIERLIEQIYEAWSHDKDLLLSEERQFGISAKMSMVLGLLISAKLLLA